MTNDNYLKRIHSVLSISDLNVLPNETFKITFSAIYI